MQKILSICWATAPTPAVHILGTSTLRICQSSMEPLPAEKYKHTRGCLECAPGTGTRPTPSYSSYSTFLLCQNTDYTSTFVKIVHGLYLNFLLAFLAHIAAEFQACTDRPLLFHWPFAHTNSLYFFCSLYRKRSHTDRTSPSMQMEQCTVHAQNVISYSISHTTER